MEKILYAQFAVFNIIILLVVWLNDVKRNRGPVLIGQRVFRGLIWVNMGAMLSDMVQVLVSGTEYRYSNITERATIFLYYVLHVVVAFLFALYVDYELYPNDRRFKKIFLIYGIPLAAVEVMNVLSFGNGWFFSIDEQNNYVRGPLYYVPTILAVLYMLVSFVMIIRHKKRSVLDTDLYKQLYRRLVLFPLFPFLGVFLQMLMPGSFWIFPATTLVILINYIELQNGYMSRDHLTGLYNRGQLEIFMNYQLKNLKKGNYFFLILIDLDKFKEINDNYGHVVGDDALIQAARLLRESCKQREDYVVRLGGDEFVIIGQCEETAVIDIIKERLNAVVDKFNKTSRKPYKIMFSMGHTICDGNTNATLDKMINEADSEMYRMKKEKKKSL